MTTRTPPLGIETRKGTFQPTTTNLDKRTVELVWSVGAPVLRHSWADGTFYEELDMKGARLERLNNGAPFLADHDGSSVLRTYGVVESARVSNGQGIAVVRFDTAENDPDADKLFRKVANGIVRSVSIGYRTHKIEKVTTEGQKIPTFRVTDFTPYEISAVTMPADDSAKFRSSTNPNRSNDMFKKRKLMQQEEGDSVGIETGNGDLEALKKREIERVAGIRAAVKSARFSDDLSAQLINGGTSLSEARGLVIDMLAARSDEIKTENHIAITGGEDASDKFMRGAVSALLERSAKNVVREAKAKGVQGFDSVDLDPGEFKNLSLLDMCRESLERSGVRTRGLNSDALAKRAFTMSKRDGGPYAGTADFPTMLENAIGKILLAAYQTTPDTWSRICKTESVDDFRASPRYRTGSFGTLDSLSENGEFKNKSIPDATKLSISTATKGNIIAISRQLIINDDMSALSDLVSKLGRAARLSIEVDFYALLALNAGLGPTVNGQPFFHSQNGNVNPVGSPLTVAGLDADRVVLGMQKDAQSNEFLDLRPETLLLPLSLGGQARVLNSSQFDPDAVSKLNMPNKVVGLFSNVIDTPRLAGTRRYLFGNPSVSPAFVCAFLRGQQSPVLENEEGWRVDGTEMKVRFDYLVQPFDVKGACTNSGV